MNHQQGSEQPIKHKENTQFRQFIQTNKEYLNEKCHEHFFNEKQITKQKIKLTALPIQKLLAFIYEIFSLQRYQQNQKINSVIKSSVQQNVREFIMELDPNKLSKSNQLTLQKLLEILTFIVQHNSIFSIQYQTKNQPQTKDLSNSRKKDPNFQVDILIDNENSINNDNSSIIDDYNNSPKLKSSRKQKLNSFSLENQFQTPSNLESVSSQRISEKLIKKNAKALFQFYCRQQMELGGLITFDRLSEQTSSMSIGKCLTFAKATNLYSALIKRQDLISKFKKVAQGKKYINFEKFQAMIGQFQVMDPNFNQRIGLLSDDIRKVLKYVKLPFNTKDVQPRQKIAVRNFSSKLTEHSGQTSQQLKTNLDQKKQELVNLRKLKQIKEYLEWKQSRPELIKQQDLKSTRMTKNKDLTVELSFIGSIIHPQQEDQMYLKQHQIPKLQKQTQKVAKFSHVFETERYQSLDKLTLRKQSVVSDIRKRIKQIQSSQNFQLAKNMKRSQLNSQSPEHRYLQRL